MNSSSLGFRKLAYPSIKLRPCDSSSWFLIWDLYDACGFILLSTLFILTNLGLLGFGGVNVWFCILDVVFFGSVWYPSREESTESFGAVVWYAFWIHSVAYMPTFLALP